MDAPTAAALIMGLRIVGKPATDVAKDLIVRLLGPSVDAAGDELKMGAEAHCTGHDTVITAESMVEKAGREIRPAPTRRELFRPRAVEQHSARIKADQSRSWRQFGDGLTFRRAGYRASSSRVLPDTCPSFYWTATGLANLASSIGTFGRISFKTIVFSPPVHVIFHWNGIRTPDTSW